MRHYLAIVATLFLLATNLTATVDASTKGNSNILLKEVFTHGSQEQLLQNWKVESGDPALYSLDAEGIVFNIPEKNKNTQISLRRSFPIEALRGYTVYASAHIRAENITQKQQPWNGAVFRATLEGRSGVMNSGGGWPMSKILAIHRQILQSVHFHGPRLVSFFPSRKTQQRPGWRWGWKMSPARCGSGIFR